MSKFLSLFVLPLSLLFVVSCGSSKKKEDSSQVGDVDADPSVSSETMSFDPSGSDSGQIEGLSTVHFDYDQSALTSSARKELSDNAQWIKSHENLSIQIEGHCDSRGSVEYNLALGERRAKAVKNYLVSLGIDGKRMTIISYGKEKLLSMGDTESDHAANRRANFVPLPQ
ncbi:MAG: OmpA family protein [Bdellovibrionales bacterium]|nr:OmpA family protein [Bdellovibrionales bacterium]